MHTQSNEYSPEPARGQFIDYHDEVDEMSAIYAQIIIDAWGGHPKHAFLVLHGASMVTDPGTAKHGFFTFLQCTYGA